VEPDLRVRGAFGLDEPAAEPEAGVDRDRVDRPVQLVEHLAQPLDAIADRQDKDSRSAVDRCPRTASAGGS
jgi:hypothetical protein